jgi:eukaryotic-like serine/threonine-protein kinase
MMRELQPGDPQLIGPYRLRGRLGAGGMGRVYLGLSPGGRAVAVKVIRADLAQDAEFRARFRREVGVARRVSGLFTAPVIDADVESPVPWLATAYVRGPSLADAVSEHGPLPAASVLVLARGLAEGLSAIHAAGVVHRDLKPANVLLAEDGPRLIDFGISRAVEASALTHTGLVVGSPGFMSPEQAEGREVGPPSDVFSLGAVLAFAATGQGPFGSGSTPALVYRVVYGAPQLDLVPAEVRALIDRCLAKDPARRPTADDLLSGAAQPAAGWLPEPVTRALTAAPPTTTAAAPSGAPAPVPPVPGSPSIPGSPPGPGSLPTAGPGSLPTAGPGSLPTAGPGRPARRARRLGRWRPLTATLVLSGLLGAGATAAVTMTAGSAPAHAAQSAPRTTPAQTLAPASTPASASASAPDASSPPVAAAPQAPPATAPAYTPPPSMPPATMTPPPSSSTPPSPTTSPSMTTTPSAGDSSSASAPAPTTATPAAQQRGY